jgi:hypothetical protein
LSRNIVGLVVGLLVTSAVFLALPISFGNQFGYIAIICGAIFLSLIIKDRPWFWGGLMAVLAHSIFLYFCLYASCKLKLNTPTLNKQFIYELLLPIPISVILAGYTASFMIHKRLKIKK